MPRSPVSEPPGLAVARAEFFDEASDFTPLLGVEAAGAHYLIASWDEFVAKSLFVKRTRGEMATLERTMYLLRLLGESEAAPGGTFIDVGANIGTSVITAIRSYRFERGLALEPERGNVRLLRANAALNGLDYSIRVLPVAASDVDGMAELLLSSENSGDHRLEGAASNDEARTSLVETVRLDSLIDHGLLDPDDTGLLWIDAQGHEGHVLAGAPTLVERGVAVTLEFHPLMLESHRGLDRLERLIAASYTHFVDLRKVRVAATRRVALHLAGDIAAFSAALRDDPDRRFTDLLLLRIPDSRQRALSDYVVTVAGS